jgi:hypothetical protein
VRKYGLRPFPPLFPPKHFKMQTEIKFATDGGSLLAVAQCSFCTNTIVLLSLDIPFGAGAILAMAGIDLKSIAETGEAATGSSDKAVLICETCVVKYAERVAEMGLLPPKDGPE